MGRGHLRSCDRAGFACVLLLAPQQPATSFDPASFANAIERRAVAGELPAVRAELHGAIAALRSAAQLSRHAAEVLRIVDTALTAGDALLAHELATTVTKTLVAGGAPPAAILGARTVVAAATLARVEFAAARSELEPLVADLTAAHGEHHPDTAIARMLLSRTWRRLGDAQRSLELAETALSDLAAALPDDARAVLTARINLGEALLDTGDVAGAERLVESACATLAATGPDHGLELNITRGILGRIKSRRGRGDEALVLHQHALEALTAAMPADHVYRLLGQVSVVFALPAGDLDRLPLAESALAGCLRTLGTEHFYTQNAHMAVAASLLLAARAAAANLHGAAVAARPHAAAAATILGRDYPQHRLSLNARALLADVEEALDRFHESRAVRSELLQAFLARYPSHFAETQLARIALAEAERRSGDLHGAALRLESALQLHTAETPAHTGLRVRILDRLAAVRADQGDLPAALRLREAILGALEMPGTPTIERLRAEQEVNALRATFDPARAAELQQRVVDAIDADPALASELPRALGNLGALYGEAGDPEQARRIAERVLALPATVTGPSRAYATNNLAEALARTGQLRTAAQLHEAAAGLFGDAAPVDAAVAQSNAAWALAQLGDDTALAAADAALARLDRIGARGDLAFVDCLRRAALIAARTDDRSAADSRVRAWSDALRERLLRWTFAPRELALWAARHEAVTSVLAARALADQAFAADYLLTSEAMRGFELRAASWAHRALSPGDRGALAALVDEVATAAAAVAVAPADRLQAAVEARDRCQRALLAELGRRGGDASKVAPRDFVRGLSPRAAVATVRSITAGGADAGRPEARQLVGTVITGDGVVQVIALGDAADTEAMVDELMRRGQLARARITLRERVLDPLSGLLPTDTSTLYLAIDDVLQQVPWDALESRTGALVGDHLSIRPLTSLFELLVAKPIVEALPVHLLACGGVDYGGAVDDQTNQRTVGADRAFRPLPASAEEVAAVAASFRAASGAAAPVVLTGRDASKAAVAAAATAATHIHIATHGYLAPELVDTTIGAGAGEHLRLAPQVLCGLALALANERGPDLTSQSGIVTAEELAAWSLERCELVVLSACEGSRGAGLRGQSLASVRSALRTAGARQVVASSWRVDDDATRQLMADFYELLLAEPPARRDSQRALWLARLRARDRGAQFRDWAGWTVTGW